MKNKLIDILKSAPYGYKSYEEYADYLLANNVIVLPCASGTPLYNIMEEQRMIVKLTDDEIDKFVGDYGPELVDKTLDILKCCTNKEESCGTCPLSDFQQCGTICDIMALKVIAGLLRERDSAEYCIANIEDALDRGSDNDWARAAIAEWKNRANT